MIILTKTETTFFQDTATLHSYLGSQESNNAMNSVEVMSIKTGGSSARQVSRAGMPAVDSYAVQEIARVCMKEPGDA